MPPWNNILNETNATGSTHDVIRRKYLRKLGQLTKRNTIVYYSGWLQKQQLASPNSGIQFGIADSDKNGFMAVIHGLDRSKGLDLLLHTPGGDMAATESLIDYLRSMFGDDIRAIVPQLAMSGGTIIALAAKQIIMGKHSSIGPIDPQFLGMSATGIIKELKKIRSDLKNDPSAVLLYQPLLAQLRPGQITECEDAISWAKDMAKRYLEANMLRDSQVKSREIVDRLTEKSNTITHGRHIGIEEAKDIFKDNVVALEGDQKLQDAVLAVHHANIITLEATSAYKIIENQHGRAFVQQSKVVSVKA